MKIEVTQEDINKGAPYRPSTCPVALAISRRLHDKRNVLVGYHTVLIDGRLYDFPPEATNFIVRFDDREPVQPFKFKLDVKKKEL